MWEDVCVCLRVLRPRVCVARCSLGRCHSTARGRVHSASDDGACAESQGRCACVSLHRLLFCSLGFLYIQAQPLPGRHCARAGIPTSPEQGRARSLPMAKPLPCGPTWGACDATNPRGLRSQRRSPLHATLNNSIQLGGGGAGARARATVTSGARGGRQDDGTQTHTRTHPPTHTLTLTRTHAYTLDSPLL